MSFFKRQNIGRVYVVKLILPDGLVVHKIGMCHSSRSTDRMMEILRSWFNKFRFVPYAELKLDMQCHNPAFIESYIHKILKPLSFEPKFKVQGSTEMFIEVNENKLITFIKASNNSRFSGVPEISDKQIEILHKLLKVSCE